MNAKKINIGQQNVLKQAGLFEDVSNLLPQDRTGKAQPRQEGDKNSSIPAEVRDGVVIRQTQCKTILNRTNISDYSLNCYTGCVHGCIYCYARFMQRFHPHAEAWGKFIDVKTNAVDVLKRQLHRTKPGAVFVSSACDGWQPLEARWKLTRRCCEMLLEHGFQVNVLTKSALVLRDFDIFAGRNASIGVTVTTLNERLRMLWEPNSSNIEHRFRVITEARQAGLETEIMFGPLLPFLSDNQSSINSMFQRAAEFDIDAIWVDTLNPRPKVWPSVAKLLRKKFPDLFDRFRQILFDAKIRAEYLTQLRHRVARGAKRFSLTDRVNECF